MNKLTFKLSLCVLLVSASTSQAMWPFNKTKTTDVEQHRTANDASEAAVNSVTIGEKTPAPNMTFSGTSNAVNVLLAGNPAYFNQRGAALNGEASSTQANIDKSFLKVQLPWCIALIGFAVGIFALCLAVKYAKAQFPAVGAAFSLADSALGSAIGKMEAHLQASNNPVEKAVLQQHLTELNKQRGIVAKSAPVAKQ